VKVNKKNGNSVTKNSFYIVSKQIKLFFQSGDCYYDINTKLIMLFHKAS